MTRTMSPTVRRRRLGIELRKLREKSTMTCEQIAEELGCAQSKISRIENGRSPISPGDLHLMLTRYGVPEPEIESMIKLAKESRRKGWWQPYAETLPEWFQVYVGLETEAGLVRNYEPQYVHGLLQTEEYATAVISSMIGVRPHEVDNRVAVRMRRQQELYAEDPLRLWALVDEAVLHRRVGGVEVMHGQLEHLSRMAELPNVTLQVVPFEAGEHPALSGPFTLLNFEDDTDTGVLFLDNFNGGQLTEKGSDVHHFNLMFEHLRAKAYDVKESEAMITFRAKEYR